jgi:hypothetical protein
MNILFIHIPKTAGSSIIDVVKKNCHEIKDHYPEFFDNHNININKLNIQSISNYKMYKSFTVVRNPYDRIVSAYNYLKHLKIFNSPDKKSQKLLEKYNTFELFIENLNILKYQIVHIVPQYLFITDDNLNILVDNIVKFENLQIEIENFDPIFKNLKHINKSFGNKDILTNEIKNIIYLEYTNDFLLFNYDK